MRSAGEDSGDAEELSETTAASMRQGEAAAHIPSKLESRVQPPWLKPVVVVLATAAHVAVIAALSLVLIEKATPVADIEVELMPEGETVTEVSVMPTPDAAPLISQDRSNATSPDPHPRDDLDDPAAVMEMAQAESLQEIALPAPKVMAPDPVPAPLQSRKAKRNANSWLEQSSKEKNARERREARRAAAQYALKRAQARARMLSAHMQFGAAARRAGVRNGSGNASHMSNAAYAALVAAEINRHKFYPAGARASGANGSVGVTFSIGPSGAIRSHSIIRSSGNSALDAAVGQMLASSHPPPPPGGSFYGSTTIHFNFER